MNINVRYWMAIVYLLIPFSLHAKNLTSLKITLADHPHAQAFKKIITDSYLELGFNVEFYTLPAERGLIELNKGNYDADVLRITQAAQRFDNLLVLPDFTLTVEWMLVCQKTIKCNEEVFRDPSVHIVVPHSQSGMIEKRFGNELSAKLHSMDVASAPLALVKAKRFDYAVFSFLEGKVPKYLDNFAKTYRLKVVYASHVVHKRHSQLIPALTTAITRRLEEESDSFGLLSL